MKTHIPILFTVMAFFGVALISGCATSEPEVGTGASFKGPIGLQLYSLRAQFGKGLSNTLDEVHGFGIKYAELAGTYNIPPADFKAQLLSHGITPISAHFGYELLR